MQKVVDPVDIHVGERIRYFRLLEDVSQHKLAKEIGCTFQQVQKYENGSNRCAPSRLFKVAKFLKKPIHLFFPSEEIIEKKFTKTEISLVKLFNELDAPSQKAYMNALQALHKVQEKPQE